MVKALNKLFIETLKLSPDMWLYIALGIVVVAFLVTLIVGLVTGEFKKVKGLMSNAIGKPGSVIAVMQKMPIHVSKQYKRARVMNMKPSDLVTEQECVVIPFKRSLISKVWIVTFIATVIAAGLAFCAGPIATLTTASGEADDAVLLTAPYIMTIVVLLVGGLLTLIGGIVGKVVYGGALKTFVKFAQAIDGDAGQAQAHTQAQAQAQAQQPMQAQQAYAYAPEQEVPVVEPQPEYANEPQAVYVGNDNDGAYVEQPMAAEPVYEPIVQQDQESDEEIRRRAREEAMAQMRAQQQAQAEQMAQAQAAAQAQQQQEEAMRAQQQAQAAAQAQAQAAARAQAQAQAAQAAQAQPASTGSSSADSVIARIEQIDREGAPRETMREVATLLQQERAKPENKTPEQQKRLNEALSKLLKAMSAASKK